MIAKAENNPRFILIKFNTSFSSLMKKRNKRNQERKPTAIFCAQACPGNVVKNGGSHFSFTPPRCDI
jgi:hypothetical protein